MKCLVNSGISFYIGTVAELEKVNEELTNLSVYNFMYDPDMVEKIKQLNADKISLENKIKSLEDIKE